MGNIEQDEKIINLLGIAAVLKQHIHIKWFNRRILRCSTAKEDYKNHPGEEQLFRHNFHCRPSIKVNKETLTLQE
jgi:hypothetical protein